MKKFMFIFILALLFGAGRASAQQTCTSSTNVGFEVPVLQATTNWGACLQYNFNNLLDTLIGGFSTLTVNSPTPSVANYSNWVTANTGATAITNFTGGFQGQVIHFLCGDTNTTLSSGTNLSLNGTFNCSTAFSLELLLKGSIWIELSRGTAGGSSGGIVAGSNISVTGSWPTQTVAVVASPSFTSLTLSSPLAVAYGGTGTASPALVAGTGIGVSGSFPNQTVSLSTPVSVANGGTGTASPSLVGGTGIVVSGLFPNQTVALSTPVSVANGGTGTATPSLVAGTGISLSGSFPNQTVALSTPVSVANGGTGTASPSLVAGTGIGVSGSFPNQTVALSTPVSVANGGTGTASPGLVAGTGISVTGTWPNQTVTNTGAGYTPTLASATLASNVTISGTTTILSVGVTFPGTGGPYRADVRYWMPVEVNNASFQQVSCAVSDGTNNFALSHTSNLSTTTVGTQNGGGGGFSTVTYSAGANITFTLRCSTNGTSGALILKNDPQGFTTSTLQVLPILAN